MAFLQGLDAAQFDGCETREIVLKLAAGEVALKGDAYLLHFVLPNFYFHVTTAYAILRHNGLDLGKTDYLGTV